MWIRNKNSRARGTYMEKLITLFKLILFALGFNRFK